MAVTSAGACVFTCRMIGKGGQVKALPDQYAAAAGAIADIYDNLSSDLHSAADLLMCVRGGRGVAARVARSRQPHNNVSISSLGKSCAPHPLARPSCLQLACVVMKGPCCYPLGCFVARLFAAADGDCDHDRGPWPPQLSRKVTHLYLPLDPQELGPRGKRDHAVRCVHTCS